MTTKQQVVAKPIGNFPTTFHSPRINVTAHAQHTTILCVSVWMCHYTQPETLVLSNYCRADNSQWTIVQLLLNSCLADNCRFNCSWTVVEWTTVWQYSLWLPQQVKGVQCCAVVAVQRERTCATLHSPLHFHCRHTLSSISLWSVNT